MKVCVKVFQDGGMNASQESIEALDLVKYGPVHEVEETVDENEIMNQLLNEFEELYPEYRYVKAELHKS